MTSEFELIKEIRKVFPRIGDDAEAFNISPGLIPLVTIDSFIEKVHFDTAYFTPYDVGYKSLSASMSDIAACGGIPRYALISVGLPTGDLKFIKDFYRGVREIAKLFNMEIIGGELTKSKIISITICVIGEVKKIIKRSGAKIGDLICVTGKLGNSFAGLLALQNGIKSPLIRQHLNPLPRIKEGKELSNYVTSMIDISDGFTIDLSHILDESKVGAKIWRNNLPINNETRKITSKFSLSPISCALNGGEEFELLFTIPKIYTTQAKKRVEFTEVGEIIEKWEVVRHDLHHGVGSGKWEVKIIDEEGNEIPVKGFDHFKI
ncbi:thiamine-phosphate kinase [candidate division WOR-3 bacterium]|nr:thiamine-phosphate kinase [candidate division WOR-3 bacterium]